MRIGVWISSMLFLASSLAAQPSTPSAARLSTMAEANAAYEAKDWTSAIRLYEQVVTTLPEPRAWYRLGVSRRNAGQPQSAIAAFEAGMKAGVPPFQAEFGIATAFAMMNEPEKALDYLERAVDHGFNTRTHWQPKRV